ncbi:hypothetical protein [Methylocystis sp. ATCC 49242]|uniref:hypothetical protein n=1 Tax=Methylocystis sp. ATCC 49242 TaxID=622637 RepID=UPI0001F87BF6|nr:hypothetical protein [Methylocystis sp. ATCC 49242]
MKPIFPLPALIRFNVLGACAYLACVGAALADTRPSPATPAPAAASAPNSGHDSSRRISKFEARRIRHACRDRANEHSLKGPERDAFLTKCFFGRASHRAVRHECAREGEAKGLDKAALRDFTRECVKERTRQKD